MSRAVQVAADLEVTVELPDGEIARGLLSGDGRRLRFEIDRPEVFAARADVAVLAGAARMLVRRGLMVDVVHEGLVLLSLGAVHAPWWHRWLTGSPHIRLAGWRSLLVPGRARLRPARKHEGVLPGLGLIPPATLFPIAPTFGRQIRRTVTTTYDPARGGQPRLVLSSSNIVDGVTPMPRVHLLKDGVTRIGAAEDCDLRLDGLDALHAEVLHDDEDELVVIAHGPEVRVNGARVSRQLLRTGSRLQIGDWVFVYVREEYADHGRPYGGRIGGELGHQRTQPPWSPLEDPPHA